MTTTLSPKRRTRFHVEVKRHRERVLVTPVGELDLSTADVLWDEMDKLRGRGFSNLVLDLRKLTFLDSTGLRLLVRARENALRSGSKFALIDGAQPVCRVLDITGLRDHFDFVRPPR